MTNAIMLYLLISNFLTIREVCYCSIFEQMQRCTSRQTKRVRDLGTLFLSRTSLSNQSPKTSGNPEKKRHKECKCQRTWRTQRKQGPLNQLDQRSHKISETKGARAEALQIFPSLRVYSIYFVVQFNGFIPNCSTEWVSHSSSFPSDIFIQFGYVSFCFIFLYFYFQKVQEIANAQAGREYWKTSGWHVQSNHNIHKEHCYNEPYEVSTLVK